MRSETIPTRPDLALRAAGAALLLVGLTGAAPADGDYPPAGLDRPGLAAWVRAHTDLAPDRVAMAGPIHLVAVSPGSRSGPIRKATVTGEVIDRDWAVRHRLVSWRTEVEVDCGASRVKSPDGRSYGQRRRKGKAAAVFASADWTSPKPGDPIFGVVRALCAADFQWPLRTAPAPRTRAAAAPGRAAKPAPGPSADAPIRTAVRVAAPPAPPPVMILDAPPPPPPVANRTPDRAKPAPSPAPARKPAGPQPSPTPTPARGAFAVQVMASSTESRARAELATLARVFATEVRGLPMAVKPATVNGKVYYRALFTGLGAPQAARLCRSIARLGYGCMVRKL